MAAPAYPRVVDARDHAAFFLNLSRTGGALVPYRAGGRPAFLANRPELAGLVLADREGAFHNPYHPYEELAGQYAPAGAFLLRLRRAGGADAAAGAAREMEDAARAFAAAAEGGEVAVDAELKERMFRATTRMLFGVDPGALAEGFVAAVGFIETCWGNGMFREGSGGPAALCGPYAHAVSVQDGAADWITRRARLVPPRGDGEALRTAVIRTLLNGYNATATALAWTLYLLARHPDEQARVRAEIRARPAAEGSAAAPLPALKAVVSEALRLYPPAWMLGRAARHAVRLGDVLVPAGAVVSVSPYTMQRHPALWEGPSEFRPDRWTARDGRPRLAALPFGAGARRCPAGALVPAHLQRFLAVVLRDLRVEPANAAPVRPRGLVALRPDPPLRLRFFAAPEP